jgi:CIC family chloride channel protein
LTAAATPPNLARFGSIAMAKGIKRQAFGLFLLAAAIGTAGGLLGAGFLHALQWLQHAVIGHGDHLASAVKELSVWRCLLTPAVGGLVAGLFLLLMRRRTNPFGISDIIGLVQLRKGTIRLRESLLQLASSACTIGSGGSIGREGANSHLAATVAAQLGRGFHVDSRTRSVLLGCGIAAGMACSYNAPIASAIFVMEAVLGNFAMDVFAPVVVASVIATMIREQLIQRQSIYGEIKIDLLDARLILSALILGIMCGFGGILFRRSLLLGKRLFGALPLPLLVRLFLGGLVVGAIGIWLPQTWGNGYDTIIAIANFNPDDPARFGAPLAATVLGLVVFKVVATAATYGSGGLGGVFTPNLVVGAAFGTFFAFALQHLFVPAGDHAEPLRKVQITFAMVGMAGLVAATMHTPITAVMLVFELTQHYELILPVMLCSIIASIVSRMLDPDSWYAESLRAKGKEIPGTIEELALKTTYVRDVMRPDPASVRDTASFDEVMELLGRYTGDTVYVVDGGSTLIGRIQLQDVKNFINDPTLSSVVIAADLARPAIWALPDDSLAVVLTRFDDPDLTELAVSSNGEPRRLLGRVTRQDVIAGISAEVLGSQLRTRFRSEGRASAFVDLPEGWEIDRSPVPGRWNDLAVDALPAEDLQDLIPLFFIRRSNGSEQRLPAAASLVVQAGMDVMALGSRAALQRLKTGAKEDGQAPE